jgi:hypothetical protein
MTVLLYFHPVHDPLIADQVKVLKNRENNLTLGFHDFSAVVETITMITENGIPIESINVAEPSLEDVFLQLTMEEVT